MTVNSPQTGIFITFDPENYVDLLVSVIAESSFGGGSKRLPGPTQGAAARA